MLGSYLKDSVVKSEKGISLQISAKNFQKLCSV